MYPFALNIRAIRADSGLNQDRFAESIGVAKQMFPESTNPAHSPRLIDSDSPDAPDVRILGKVVWFDCDVN